MDACPAKYAACRNPVELGRLDGYSSTIDTALLMAEPEMNMNLGLRALALVAFVAASTFVIVKPDWIDPDLANGSGTLNSVVTLVHG